MAAWKLWRRNVRPLNGRVIHDIDMACVHVYCTCILCWYRRLLMSAEAKRVREQAVVYLAERDRALLEELVRESGLSRAELFRRGLWALAQQMRGTAGPSAFEELIAGAPDFQGPSD